MWMNKVSKFMSDVGAQVGAFIFVTAFMIGMLGIIIMGWVAEITIKWFPLIILVLCGWFLLGWLAGIPR